MQVIRKKPDADFVIRLVGPQMKPWAVPLRRLAKTLEAVQRLMEPNEEPDDEIDVMTLEQDDGESQEVEPRVDLRLIDVKSSSAAYRVASSDRPYVLEVLGRTGRAINRPESSGWPSAMLSSLRELSDTAKSLNCRIEFRTPGNGTRHGELLAAIDHDTYQNVSGTAFVLGSTSILGRIERVGGATEMHCGLRIPEQPRKMVICRVATAELVRELGKYMYQDVVVSGKATWIRHDWRLRQLVIHSFEPPKNGSIVDALKRIYDAGGSAWDTVDDPDAKIAEMRGW